MMQSIRNMLDHDGSSLSKGHRKLAQFISENIDEVPFLTSGKLAELTDLSEATVIRFVRSIGYDGYSDFKKQLQNSIKTRITPTVKIKDTVEKLHREKEVFANWLHIDKAMLAELENNCSEDDIQRAVSFINERSTVYIVGFGVSKCVVDFLDFRLTRLRYKVVPVTCTGSAVIEKLMTLASGDVMIGVGFFRPHRELIVASDVAAELSIPKIAITDSDSSPVAAGANVVLRANRGPSEIMTSLSAPMIVANMLTVALARKNEERAINAFSELDRLREKYNL